MIAQPDKKRADLARKTLEDLGLIPRNTSQPALDPNTSSPQAAVDPALKELQDLGLAPVKPANPKNHF